MAFLVVEFVLVMQFLWKYLDDIIGKGISFGVVLELIFYFAIRIIPEAVPVTILISSVMVFGNLAEKYELSSMKSAGISLTRVMMAGLLLAIATSGLSLFASNYLKPRANHKFLKRYVSIKKQDLTLNIEEGVFSQDFKNFTIKVGEKGGDGESISDIIIYDNTGPDKNRLNMLVAQSGKMYADGSTQFVMDLGEGEQYREMVPADKKNDNYPFMRTNFKSYTKVFDMSEFDFEAESWNKSRKKYDLLNAIDLKQSIDSFDLNIAKNISKNRYSHGDLLPITIENEKATEVNEKEKLPKKVTAALEEKDKQVKANKKKEKKKTPLTQDTISPLEVKASLLATFSQSDATKLTKTMKYLSDTKMNSLIKNTSDNKILGSSKNRFTLRLHQMFSWALICTVFLFIGAPLGSIIKKGGYGYPLLLAIVFFMLFIILNIMGDKLTLSGEVPPILGAWLPNLVLIPVAFIITYKALKDSTFTEFQKIGAIIKAKLTK